MGIKVHKREVDIDLLPVYVVSSVPDEVLYNEEVKMARYKELAHLQALRLERALKEAALDEADIIGE